MAWDIHPEWCAPLPPALWLEIATYGLAPEAAARVRSEYLAHLEDAQDAGETAEGVLREWGDPHKANDALKKAYLTTTEAWFVHPGYAFSTAGWRRAVFEENEIGRSGLVILLPLLFTVVRTSLQLPPEACVLAALLIALAVPTLRWLIIAGLRLSGAARVVVAWLLRGWGRWRRCCWACSGGAGIPCERTALAWAWRPCCCCGGSGGCGRPCGRCIKSMAQTP